VTSLAQAADQSGAKRVEVGRRTQKLWSLRGFAAALSLTLVLPGALIAYLAIDSYRNREIQRAFDQVDRIQTLIAEAHQQWATSGRDTLALIRNRVAGTDVETCSSILSDSASVILGFGTIIRADRDGIFECGSDGPVKPIDISDRDYFKEAVSTGKFAVGRYIFGRISQKPFLPMALPIFDAQNRISGLLITGKEPTWIEQRLSDRNLPEGTRVSIVDRSGKVFVRAGSITNAEADMSDDQVIVKMVETLDPVHMHQRPDGTQWIMARAAISSVAPDVFIVVEVPASSLLSSIRGDFLRWTGLILVIAMLTAVTVFYLIDHLLSQPLRDLGRSLTGVAKGKLAAPVALKSSFLEIDVLSRQVSLMIKSLLKRNKQNAEMTDVLVRSNSELEQFAQIASHDLQEPLRKISAFGSLIEKRYASALDEEGKQYLSFMIGGAIRSQALIQELLAYSRIGRELAPFNAIDLNEVLKAALANVELAANEARAKIEVCELPTIIGNANLLGRLFQNLLMNSLKYRSKTRDLEIRITQETRDGEVTIAVSDNGIGFAQDQADNAFLPFRRLVGKSQADGTGMGLAICRKIVERHNGRISATSPLEQGATFQIVLPLSQPYGVGEEANA
jgi:signal transduction histidine kinase